LSYQVIYDININLLAGRRKWTATTGLKYPGIFSYG